MSILVFILLRSQVTVRSGDFIYLLLVAILWYLVGKKLDYHQSRVKKVPSVRTKFWNFAVLVYGLYLFLVICLHNVIFTSPSKGNGGSSNFVGDVIRQGLWLLWSLALITLSGRTLISENRRGEGFGEAGAARTVSGK
jgi:hypothetical protein